MRLEHRQPMVKNFWIAFNETFCVARIKISINYFLAKWFMSEVFPKKFWLVSASFSLLSFKKITENL